MQEDYTLGYSQEELEELYAVTEARSNTRLKVVSMSDLSKEDYRLFYMDWEEFRLKSVKEFVSLNFLEISQVFS